MKILFTGGGTLGPVTPLLAVAESWKKHDPEIEFVWVGTKQGPERDFIEKEGIRFQTITTVRLVRHMSVEWFFIPLRFFIACLQACVILAKEKPNLIAAAGGYTSVPVVIIGSFMGIPSWIHQSDVHPIMTNRLLAPFATWITVAWEKTKRAFPSSKTFVVGNPVREVVRNGIKARAEMMFQCDPKKPTVFVFGGGTGSQWINDAISEVQDELFSIANVIHVTGKGKLGHAISKPGYFVIESMIDEMPDAYAIADVVVSRAGAGAISELAALKKAAIIIPLPNSPQEENAKVIERAALVLHQNTITSKELYLQIRRLLNDPLVRLGMGQRLGLALETNCAEKIVNMLGNK